MRSNFSRWNYPRAVNLAENIQGHVQHGENLHFQQIQKDPEILNTLSAELWSIQLLKAFSKITLQKCLRAKVIEFPVTTITQGFH